MIEHISKNLAETQKIAEEIAKNISGGEVFALEGDLGSGKTTFTKLFAESLGITDQVTSPTFVISKYYPFTLSGRKMNLVHIDAYRFSGPSESESIGLKEIISDPQNVVIIEWAEKVWPIIRDRAQVIKFEFIDENTRKLITDLK